MQQNDVQQNTGEKLIIAVFAVGLLIYKSSGYWKQKQQGIDRNRERMYCVLVQCVSFVTYSYQLNFSYLIQYSKDNYAMCLCIYKSILYFYAYKKNISFQKYMLPHRMLFFSIFRIVSCFPLSVFVKFQNHVMQISDIRIRV